MKKIIIENVKRIKHLEFEIPEDPGVYLIVGENGAGKTTLLVCLDRICNPRAFATGFNVSKKTPDIDQYKNAVIKYKNNESIVRFRRGEKKWMPTPKTGAAVLLQQMGYSETIFIKADSRRIDATQEEIASGLVKQVSQEIKDVLNRIFSSHRYDDLRRLKISNGRGKNPTYMYIMGRKATGLYSEKRFSTGELAIIRLVESIQSVDDNAMVLVDEAEMALHPRIQIELLNYLNEMAIRKNLTVFISTHSTTLIKMTDKKHIMLLEDPNDDGMSRIDYPCYPAKAIGGVDDIANSGFDVIFFVEDDMAQSYLDCAIRRLRAEESELSTLSYAIFPIGGFFETGRIAINTKERLFSGIKVFAVVDADAFEDLEHKPKFERLLQENDNRNYIKSLEITPEVWFCSELETADVTLRAAIRNNFHFEISSITGSSTYQNLHSDSDRQLAKDKFKKIYKQCEASSGLGEEAAKTEIIRILVEHKPIGEIKHLLMPMLRR